MGPEGAVNMIFRQESERETEAARELDRRVPRAFANPYTAAERGYVDEVIEPRRTRPVLIDASACDEARAAPAAQARQHPALDADA